MWHNQLQNGGQSWKPVFEIVQIIWAINYCELSYLHSVSALQNQQPLGKAFCSLDDPVLLSKHLNKFIFVFLEQRCSLHNSIRASLPFKYLIRCSIELSCLFYGL